MANRAEQNCKQQNCTSRRKKGHGISTLYFRETHNYEQQDEAQPRSFITTFPTRKHQLSE